MVLQLCPTPTMSFHLQSNHLGMNARTATRNSHRYVSATGSVVRFALQLPSIAT